MRPFQPRSIIFDLDGTLVDSLDDIYHALRAAYKKTGLRFSLRDKMQVGGPPLKETIRAISPRIAARNLSRVMDQFKEHYDASGFPHSKLYPGVRKMLGRLSSASIGIFIATNKRMAPTAALLKKLRAERYFDAVFTPDMDKGVSLDKAAMIGRIIRSHGLDKKRTALVGDLPSDIRAARENGIISVAVLNGYCGEEALRASNPDLMLDSTADLLCFYPAK